jgi:hypothetical protein
MDDYDVALAVAVRVGVLLGWAAVRGPARMPDSVNPVERLETEVVLEVSQLSGNPANHELLVFVDNRQAGGVVAPIL